MAVREMSQPPSPAWQADRLNTIRSYQVFAQGRAIEGGKRPDHPGIFFEQVRRATGPVRRGAQDFAAIRGGKAEECVSHAPPFPRCGRARSEAAAPPPPARSRYPTSETIPAIVPHICTANDERERTKEECGQACGERAFEMIVDRSGRIASLDLANPSLAQARRPREIGLRQAEPLPAVLDGAARELFDPVELRGMNRPRHS
jgi:hypothetical protein